MAQVGEAVSQMDQATQQNAALVEESAAAAESLQAQAEQLVQAVSVFKLAAGEADAPSPAAGRSAAAPTIDRRDTNRARKVVRPGFGLATQPRLAAAMAAAQPGRHGSGGEWASF